MSSATPNRPQAPGRRVLPAVPKYTTVGPNVSNVNIKRAVEHIRTTTTVYTAVIEIIVNAIQAIDECGHDYGQVSIRTIRDSQSELDGTVPQVAGFEIRDNGVGFTQAHRDSFDTLYTDRRISEGGKGFGRFICLKYFDGLHIESVYLDGARLMSRSFSMGTGYDIIVGERITESEHPHSGTVVRLSHLKRGDSFDKRPDTIARRLVERLLPYFITQDYVCPDIVLSEYDGSQAIRLNDFIDTQTSILRDPYAGQSIRFDRNRLRRELCRPHFQVLCAQQPKESGQPRRPSTRGIWFCNAEIHPRVRR